MKHPVRIAHRGGSLLAPENTLAAFRNALTMPVDFIELDVQMSRDGQVIVFHDTTVERLTNGTGNILDLDLSYLRSLDAASHFPGGWPQPETIPLFREVLDLVRNRVKICVEIKLSQRDDSYGRYPQIAETVLRELRMAKLLQQALIISFDWATLARIRKLEPDVVTGALVSRELWSPDEDDALAKLCAQVTSLGCNWISMDRNLFTPAMLPVLHENGFKVGLWTVNDLSDLRALVDLGVDSLTTDRPDFFAHL